MSTNNDWVLFEKKNNARRRPKKNSKGEIRTLDLTGMSRALSPTELPCHINLFYSIFIWLSCFERGSHGNLTTFAFCSLGSYLAINLFYSIFIWLSCFERGSHGNLTTFAFCSLGSYLAINLFYSIFIWLSCFKRGSHGSLTTFASCPLGSLPCHTAILS